MLVYTMLYCYGWRAFRGQLSEAVEDNVRLLVVVAQNQNMPFKRAQLDIVSLSFGLIVC